MHSRPNRPLILLLSVMLSIISTGFVPLRSARAVGKTVKIVLTSGISAMTVPSVDGPLNYGAEFGVDETEASYVTFDSNLVAVQALLSGEGDVLYGSFLPLLPLREAGQDFKMFCPVNSQIDHVLVGRNGIKTLTQVVDAKTRVGIDTPGGGGSTILDAVLLVNKTGVTVSDLKNTKLLDSVTLRQTGWVANEIDVTTMRLSQFRQSQKDVPDGVIILKPYEELPVFIFASFIAPTKWLDTNRETAAGLCASILKSVVALTKTFDTYDAAVHALVAKPPSDEALRESYSLITQYGFWAPAKSMNPDSITFMAKVAMAGGLIKTLPDPNEVLDMQTYNMPLAMLSEDERAALTRMATLPASGVTDATPEAIQGK